HLLMLSSLIGMLLVALAACGDPEPEVDPTATPAPTSEPTTEPTPDPTAMPDPTATPQPDYDEIGAELEPGVVQLSANGESWSGVMIGDSGVLLSSARNLGSAPVVDFTTSDGESGQAWTVGRDDDYDIVLLEVVDGEEGGWTGLDLGSGGAPDIGDALLALTSGGSSEGAVEHEEMEVSDVVLDDDTGAAYLQLAGQWQDAGAGGAVVDRSRALVGLLITRAHLEALEIGSPDEGPYALAAESMSAIYSDLEGGRMAVAPPEVDENGEAPSDPPQFPSIFTGAVAVGGESPDEGSRVYAQVVVDGGRDQWFSQPVGESGSYSLAVALLDAEQDGEEVRFWMDGTSAEQTAVYDPGETQSLDITFP
ncbi:MAG: serine protease, partial [Dehalococcoidia bacterium]